MLSADLPARARPAAPIRVFLVDDEQLVRMGFRVMLEAEPDLVVVGEARDGQQALAGLRETPADIVLMDMRMPILNGVEATDALMHEFSNPPRVIAVTTFDEDDFVFKALEAGASGYLLKDTSMELLVNAVRRVHGGENVLHPSITSRLINSYLARDGAGAAQRETLPVLTPRENEVLRLLADGLSNAEIAATLFLGETTVKSHVSSVLSKLNVRDRSQAIGIAFRFGLMKG